MNWNSIRFGLWLRVAVRIFLAVAVLLMYSAAALQLQEQRRITITSEQAVNLGIARVLANNVAHLLRTAEFIHYHVIQRIGEQGLASMTKPEGYVDLHGLAERFPEVAYITVMDGAGNVIANSQNPNPPKINNADREYFIAHLRGEDLVIGQPIRSRVTGREVFTFTRALRDRGGSLQAIALVGIEREYMEQLFKTRGKNETVTLIRADGTILVRSPQVAVNERLPSTADIFSLVRKAESGSYESFSPIDGEQRLFSYSKTGEYPLYLMVSEIKDEVLAPWRESISRTVAVLASASIALLCAGWLILRVLRREERIRLNLEESRRYQDAVLNSMSSHVAILGPDATIISTNKSWQDFAKNNGYHGRADMAGLNYFDVCRRAATEEAERAIAGISSVMLGALPRFQYDYECNSSSEKRWFTMTVTPLLANRGSVLVSHADVTRLKSVEELLRERAQTDALTGLANRGHFFELANHEFGLAHRHKKPLSLMMVDCDHFKQINDRYGHEAGDQVLVAMAKAMQGCVRNTDIVARIGGEEFTILLPETPLRGALMVAEEIRAAIEALEVDSVNGVVRLTASLGVVEYAEAVKNVAVLMRAADSALYAAKKNGRNRVEVGDPTVQQEGQG
ncbi:diguanylate cyclase [Noviherbaspirillum agri]